MFCIFNFFFYLQSQPLLCLAYLHNNFIHGYHRELFIEIFSSEEDDQGDKMLENRRGGKRGQNIIKESRVRETIHLYM